MERKQALAGIKVIDFGWMVTAATFAKQLGLHGATVVRVESHRKPDPLRTGGVPVKPGASRIDANAYFAAINPNKYGISLDLSHPKGKEIVHKLIKWADIAVEGFQPGVMKDLGLDYESVKNINPRIIYVSTSQLGQSGPHALFPGTGLQAASLAGFNHLTGWPDRPPPGVFGPYTDFVAPRYMIVCVMGALLYRERTGKGTYIDVSQMEASVGFLTPSLLDYTVNGRILHAMGNQHPFAAPHSAFPCKDADTWCAIAVFTDAEWAALCDVIGNPEWTHDSKFATIRARKKNEEELNKLVGEWTAEYITEELVELLQKAGISAGKVNKPKDLFEDPQLEHRQHFQFMEHREIGRQAYQAPAYRLSETPFEVRMPGPCIGQHNEYVFKEMLGLSDDEIADLLVEGVITTDADLPEVG